MSVVKNKWVRWQQVIGVGLICSLAVAGCSRSDNDNVEANEAATEQQTVNEADIAPAMSCDDPLVQDRLRTALKNTLTQQSQTVARNYANTAEVSIDSSIIDEKVGNILIDVQNVALLQEANATGMTTCQASVSMTLPSEDLYQASLVDSSNNKPSLQSRLASDNIRINNNMLVDDAFSYVIGTQNGLVQARIAGQPALINIVADVMAGSSLKAVMDQQQAMRRAEAAAERRAAIASREESQTRQPRAVTPVEPIRQATPATPPTINQSNTDNNQASSSATNNSQAAVTPSVPKVAPKDDTIDMVIVEDDSATY